MRTHGFTLLELLVTLAVMVILIGFVAPAMANLIERNQGTTLSNQLLTSLNLARHTAVLHGRTVAVCKSADGTKCTSDGDWSQGWIVFEDIEKNGDCQFSATTNTCAGGGRLLQYHEGSSNQKITLHGNQNVSRIISYNPQGRAAMSNGTLTVCRKRNNEVLSGMVISPTGRIRQAASGDNTSCSEPKESG